MNNLKHYLLKLDEKEIIIDSESSNTIINIFSSGFHKYYFKSIGIEFKEINDEELKVYRINKNVERLKINKVFRTPRKTRQLNIKNTNEKIDFSVVVERNPEPIIC